MVASSRSERGARSRKWRSQIILIVGAIVLVYLLLADILAVVQVYRIDSTIVQLQKQTAELQNQNQDLNNLIAYLKTDSFREKVARRELGYQKPGEKVLIIPNPAAATPGVDNTGSAVQPTPSREDILNSLPTYKKWWYYFFVNM